MMSSRVLIRKDDIRGPFIDSKTYDWRIDEKEE
jgi:hypothetical protein